MIVSILDTELEAWLNTYKNKSKIIREAVREYKQRHFEGVYFTKKEVLKDIEKHEKNLQEAEMNLPKLKKLLKKIEEKESTKE